MSCAEVPRSRANVSKQTVLQMSAMLDDIRGRRTGTQKLSTHLHQHLPHGCGTSSDDNVDAGRSSFTRLDELPPRPRLVTGPRFEAFPFPQLQRGAARTDGILGAPQ